jgi:tetratricopeptide (TPR) repeat protein
MTLNNLAILYRAHLRTQEAEHAYTEALTIRRRLAEANPDAYLPDVATTLNNLALLYRDIQRVQEAERAAIEAEQTLAPYWEANPTVHGDQMAKILLVRAALCESGGNVTEACTLARRALPAAYDPDLKEVLQRLIAEVCPSAEEAGSELSR